LRANQEQLVRLQHDKLLALKSYKAAEVALTEAQELLPSLRIARCHCYDRRLFQIVYPEQIHSNSLAANG